MSSRPSRGAARLAAILDALPDALLLVNCNGTIVNANHIALESFEAPGTALVGRGLLDLLPSFDPNRIPGSMRRPDEAQRDGIKPTRMMARRTDGAQFPVEVTSANLEDGRTPYADQYSYTGDELLMLIVRDLTGTLDTEAELARQQRQTEMILRAAAEGVVGVDTEGKVVLVNPSAAQILGYRASDMGGQELHSLVHHSRPDGSPFPYEESPLADTLRSGRKHRVRGQVLWAKDGGEVPVDLTTAPVRDGEQLVGAVLTFTDRRPETAMAAQHAEEVESLTTRHTEEVESLTARHAEEVEELTTQHTKALEELQAQLAEERARYAAQLESVTARNGQLLAVLDQSLRGPLLQLRHELGVLADDPAGQLWPEANQILHHLAAGYTRMTTLVDNVLSYQRLDADGEELARRTVSMDEVVSAGVEGAVELIGPGRAQFAVHAPPIDTEVDPERLAQALAHLIADVAGVDSTGNTAAGASASDSTIVVAAAQRGDVVRIEVRGPYAGGDPVHEPIVRGIVRQHGGVLQTHEMPGMGGHAYVLEVPISAAAAAEQERVDGNAAGQGDGTRGQGTSGTGTGVGTGAGAGTGAGTGTAGGNPSGQTPAARHGRHGTAPSGAPGDTSGGGTQGNGTQGGGTQGGTPPPNLRKADPNTADPRTADPRTADPRTAAQQGAPGAPAALPAVVGDNTAAQQGSAVEPADAPRPTGRRRARPHPDEDPSAVAAANPAQNAEGAPTGSHRHARGGAPEAAGPQPTGPAAMGVVPPQGIPAQQQPQGRRARRGAPAQEQGGPPAAGAPAQGAGGRPALALPAAPSDTPQQPAQPAASGMPALPPARTPQEQQPNWSQNTSGGQPPETPPTGRRRARRALADAPESPTPDQAQAQAPGQPQPQPQPQQAQPQPQPQAAGEPGLVRSPFALPPAAADRAQPGAMPPELGPAGLVPAQHGTRDGRGAPQPQQGGGLAVRGEPVPPNGAARPGGWPSDPAQAQAQDPRRPQPQPQAQGSGPAQPAASGMPALPPARTPQEQQPNWGQNTSGGQPPETPPTGRRRARRPLAEEQPEAAQAGPQPVETGGHPPAQPPAQQPAQWPDAPAQPRPQPLPAEAPPSADTTQGRSISVRTLGQGVPFAQQVGEHPQGQAPQGQPQGRPPQGQPQTPSGGTSTGGGRRRKLAARPEMTDQGASAELQPAGSRAHPHTGPHAHGGQQPHTGPQPHPGPQTGAQPRPQPGPGAQPQRAAGPSQSSGRTFAIGAPDEGAEGPEPLDGPNGAVEIVDDRTPPPDDELPPEPLDNPRRLLVWPAPDMSTQQALSDRGYRPVIVNSREEVDAQIAAYPAALFVDPLTGPITRTALQSLRTAAVAAEVPVLVTAGLGQATREAAYGADPAVLLKALAPRDSEQHPPRVLLIEEHEPIAAALTATLERRGMHVARAATDADAVSLAGQMRPNLVVMDLMQVRRRRAGIVDWLRGNGLLNRTPLVVYTSADIDPANLSRLASGETVLFLAERSTSAEVQARIVDLLAKIGTN
ncbi:sensory histidine kinase AtoS [Streptomyces malaysiensis subsp. malaysiensis]|uniref:hybrid sensor histidine kinase/response regulator n=2 Tax=Streptomyces malaysiensis TaxID=92644 RepID=UPI000C2C19ED|nr:PAS domain-containing protein [Streptomyces sp. M56]AUA12721.1 sensory histidine kinase AtoS [Streptomyces sp. M56]